jgi:photosystem II stability/assembly factor-like uncharacterized protein
MPDNDYLYCDMRKQLFTLVLVLIQFSYLHSQWVQQTSGSTATLFAVHFVNASQGWTAGTNGTILHTADGGQNWMPQTTGITTALNAIWFADALNGWAAGDGGVIIATTDGGQTWNPQTTNSVSKLRTLWFFNSDTGYVAGQGGIMLRTVNGGGLWTQVGTAVNQDIYSLGFADQSTGFISGRNGNFQKTVNGGTLWTNGPPPPPLDTLKAVRAPAASDIYVTTNSGKVLKTDGLGNWSTQQPGSVKSLNGAWFTSATTGWVAGDSGRVFTTTTGGAQWLMQSSSTTERLWAVHFPNDSAGWCVGTNGTIIKLTLLTTSAQLLPAAYYNLTVYPNPAAAFSPISLNTKLPQRELLTIEVYDAATGKIVLPAFQLLTEAEDTNCIYAPGLSSGNYIITIRNNFGAVIQSQKITVSQ